MKRDMRDELIVSTDVGNVGQLTEIEEDNDVSCIFLNLEAKEFCENDADCVFLTRADLLFLLSQLEDHNER